MPRPALLLLALLLAGIATGEEPTTWVSGSGTSARYLTIQDSRACIQFDDGFLVWAIRLIPDKDGMACYQSGRPNGQRLLRSAASVTMVEANGERMVYASCTTPPERIGWQPYQLPAPEADAAKRKQVADELCRRFAKEQQLRGEAMRLSQGRMGAEAMKKAEVQKAWQAINTVDEDNRQWLEQTLRSGGWIGRKSHGDQAHQALLLISLHNVQQPRFAATILAGMQAEQQRGDIAEASVANITDRLALVLGDPLQYGIQATVDSTGKPIIPVIADLAKLNANRARIGQPAMAAAANMMGARILRIGEDGRLAGEGAGEASGLDALDGMRAMREPAWGLAAAGKADPVLGAAIAACSSASMAAWTRTASQQHRDLVARILMGQGQVPGGDAEAAVMALRPLFDGLLDGLPPNAEARIIVGNVLAYSLVGRAKAPTAEELARAGALVDSLERAIQRPEVAANPMGHAIVDTIACIRFRQGDRAKAAAAWKKAIALAGAQVPNIYRTRLAVAEGVDAAADLPR